MEKELASNSVPGSHLALLASFCEREAIAIRQILDKERIQTAQLHHPDTVLSAHQHTRILLSIDDKLTDESFWLRFGQYMDFPAYGPFGQALLSCTNIGESIAFLCRYYPVISCGSILSYSRSAKSLSVIIKSDDSTNSRKNRLKNELLASLIFTGIKKFADNSFDGIAFDFAYDAPALEYTNYLNRNCRFSRPATRIIIPNQYLLMPCPHTNPVMLEILSRECDQLLDKLTAEISLVPKVKSLISAVSGQFPPISIVAMQLGLSERTLSRYLKEAGTNYRKLLTEVRIQKAVSLLRQSSISIEEIAYEMGYSNSANFRKAVVTSIGLTPSAIRREGKPKERT